jgi:hypothetical protein
MESDLSRRYVTSFRRDKAECAAQSDNDYIKIPGQIHFVLCEVCYWCATFFNINENPVVKCPYCDSIRIEPIPMSYNEVCKFRYDPIRGVTMEFSTVKVTEGGDP